MAETGPERCYDSHRQQDCRDREDKVRCAHDKLVHPPAEVAREPAKGASDRERKGDQQHGERDRDASAPQHAREDVPAELVGAHDVRGGRWIVKRDSLRQRILRSYQRCDHGDHEPERCNDEPDDGHRLPPRTGNPAPRRERPAEGGAHATRILGSTTPYRMSTTMLTRM